MARWTIVIWNIFAAAIIWGTTSYAVPAMDSSVSFSYGGYPNAGLMYKVTVAENAPSMQMVIIQCAVSLNKGNAYTAVLVHFIFDLPLPFIVLNTQCFRA